jgi:hypothetical protein
MDRLTIFGLFAVTTMVVCYALENRNHWFVLAFAGSCVSGSVYRFLQSAWPFGLVEGGYGQHGCPPAETPQLLPFKELAAVTDHFQAALSGAGNQRGFVALLPLRLGGAGEDVRLHGAVRARSSRSQQQSRASFLLPEGQGEIAFTGKLRTAGGRRSNSVAAAFVGT